MPRHQALWFDVETTGLIGDGPGGPKPGDLYGGGLLLEWALALAEDDAGGDCTIVQEYTAVVHHEPAALASCLDDYVRKMHTKNGLLVDVEASTTTLADSDAFLFAICQELTGKAEPRGLELAGFSAHFDLAWCKVHLPRFASCLSHRVFNVSTLRKVAFVHFPDGGPKQENPDRHRAPDDVRASINYYRDWLRVGGLIP
jgi:oligoribonuclease